MTAARALVVAVVLATLAVLAIGPRTVRDVFDRHAGRAQIAVVEAQRSLPRRLAAKGLGRGDPVFIRIFKEESALELWMRDDEGWRLFEAYQICRWSGRLGPKLREGDRQAPEGFYEVSLPQLNPYSRHHLAMNIGFPNTFDRAHGRTGSFLMIHGGCASIGCYAMTDASVDDIYRLVEAALNGGQRRVPIHIFPFRMTEANIERHAASKWAGFWQNLKHGYDTFERGRLPAVDVVNGRYRIAAADHTLLK
jgi:murein L,D-transpeptidase YafK